MTPLLAQIVILLIQAFGPALAEIATAGMRLLYATIRDALPDDQKVKAAYEAEVLYRVAYLIVEEIERTNPGMPGEQKRTLAQENLRRYRGNVPALAQVKDGRLNTIIEEAHDRLEEIATARGT